MYQFVGSSIGENDHVELSTVIICLLIPAGWLTLVRIDDKKRPWLPRMWQSNWRNVIYSHKMLERIIYNYYKMKKSRQMLCTCNSLRESCDLRYLRAIIVITLNTWLTLSKYLLKYYLTPFSQQMQELSHLVGKACPGSVPLIASGVLWTLATH